MTIVASESACYYEGKASDSGVWVCAGKIWGKKTNFALLLRPQNIHRIEAIFETGQDVFDEGFKNGHIPEPSRASSSIVMMACSSVMALRCGRDKRMAS